MLRADFTATGNELGWRSRRSIRGLPGPLDPRLPRRSESGQLWTSQNGCVALASLQGSALSHVG